MAYIAVGFDYMIGQKQEEAEIGDCHDAIMALPHVKCSLIMQLNLFYSRLAFLTRPARPYGSVPYYPVILIPRPLPMLRVFPADNYLVLFRL